MRDARLVLLSLLALGWSLPALDVELCSPLTTVVPCDDVHAGPRRVSALITVPDTLPEGLGVGVVVRDRDGRWFQRLDAQVLRPGTTRIDVVINAATPADAHPLPLTLTAADLSTCERSALILWSATAGTQTIRVEDLRVEPLEPRSANAAMLRDLSLDGYDATQGICRIACGERWSLSVVPDAFPANPYDPDQFRLDAHVIGPDGERHLAGFFAQDVRLDDRGDAEQAIRHGHSRFNLRFRPAVPGRYAIRLTARWGDGRESTHDLPPLEAHGPAVDQVVRVDAQDPRFFSVGEKFWWPNGINLHSTYDKRAQQVCATILTPHRGSLVYEAIIPRIAAAGIDACEIWMSSWNLGLEWRADWPGFEGPGRYAQGNALRLDRVLDLAWQHGIRVNLVINNHGQASAKSDREWKDNPYNRDNGGPLSNPEEVFAHPEAALLQERLRRYIIARYADHPAIMGWKLWSEVDLTAGKGKPLVDWHDHAAARWQALDTYGHPCTTHWCGTYTHVNRDIAALDRIDYLCIDAYRLPDKSEQRWSSLADLMANSLHDPARGLLRWNKPLLVTEYGSWNQAPPVMRITDLRLSSFTALVSGHAGAPMTWWWEWIDQNEYWASYRAIARFLAGEDLRGSDARSIALVAKSEARSLWCRAWVRPGRMLIHVVDPRFATHGEEALHQQVRITIGTQVRPGRMRVQWYDPDSGDLSAETTIDHPGGDLILSAPDFRAHLAAKCWREDNTDDVGQAADDAPMVAATP